jgi:hypothetical protein
MTPRSERDVILDHALQSKENLEIALKIGAAYDDLVGNVILRFLGAVENDLTTRLGKRWKITICSDVQELSGRYVQLLTAALLDHPGQFHIVLGADDLGYPKKVWVGVRAPNAALDIRAKVKQVIERLFPNGKSGDPSFWWRYFDKSYVSWGDEDTPLLLYGKTEALDSVVGNLECLARAIQESLDSDTNSTPSLRAVP